MARTPAAIHEEDEASTTVELDRRLQASNEQQLGPRRTRKVTLSIRDDSDRLIAGLNAELHWNGVYVATVWVEEEHRRNGYGTTLMNRIETIAREHPCDVIFLTTLTFQAPGFYERLGYRRLAELPYGNRGFSRVFFAKSLADYNR